MAKLAWRWRWLPRKLYVRLYSKSYVPWQRRCGQILRPATFDSLRWRHSLALPQWGEVRGPVPRRRQGRKPHYSTKPLRLWWVACCVGLTDVWRTWPHCETNQRNSLGWILSQSNWHDGEWCICGNESFRLPKHGRSLLGSTILRPFIDALRGRCDWHRAFPGLHRHGHRCLQPNDHSWWLSSRIPNWVHLF